MFLTIITNTLLSLCILDITPHHRKTQETGKRLQVKNITDASIEIPIKLEIKRGKIRSEQTKCIIAIELEAYTSPSAHIAFEAINNSSISTHQNTDN